MKWRKVKHFYPNMSGEFRKPMGKWWQKMKQDKFNVGDRVILKSWSIGSKGTIIKRQKTGSYAVALDDGTGHNCNGLTPNGGLWISENDLEFENNPIVLLGQGGLSAPAITVTSSTSKSLMPPFVHSFSLGGTYFGNSFNPAMDYETVEVKSPENKKPKTIKLSEKALDGLILDEKVKQEIISVMKQHQNHDQIFKKWGLGETIEYGKGMTFMFWGTPGTGKTWCATLMARALGKELLTLTAAEIQSQEPGAANRNIQQAFQTAKDENKVILLDECDSLIFDRKHLGMILASEVNTLLTEIEKFEGVCILATNQISRMDEALERRISLIVEFPKPNFVQRVQIWKNMIPKKFPLAEEVTYEALAEHELTGGLIKNVLLNAARMASSNGHKKVTLDSFNQAINRVKSSKNLMGKVGQQAVISEGVSVGVNRGQPNIDTFFSNHKNGNK